MANRDQAGPEDRRSTVEALRGCARRLQSAPRRAFLELDRERAGARQAKERLCQRAEELSGSTDWAGTAATFRELFAEWKTAGGRPKRPTTRCGNGSKLLRTFFAARNAVSAERDAELVANAEAKAKLLAEAERIDPSNTGAARAPLRGITEKWDAIGKAPKEQSADLERRLRAVEQKVRDSADAARIDREAQARAAQFRSRAEQFERQAEKAAAAGRDKEAAEARASAAQWREWADAAAKVLTKRR